MNVSTVTSRFSQGTSLVGLVAALLIQNHPTVLAQQVPALSGLFSLPAMYRNVELPFDGGVSSGAGTVLGTWWGRYGSGELNLLVDQALANNPDLRIATLQIAQARIRSDQTRAGSMPFVSGSLRTVSQSGGTTVDAQQSSQAALQGTYRLDIWGEQKALEASAELQMWRSVYERQNVERNVVGNLVTVYIAWLEVSDSIAILRENETLTRRILQTMEQRFSLGDATIAEVEMQRAAVHMAAAQIASLENQRDDYHTVIARVLGTSVLQVPLAGRGLDDFVLPALDTGLPSRLILQRPDVRLVEARLQAAKADIDVVRARLLPPIDLSAQVGYSALGMANLLQPQNFLVNAIASLAATIFDGGRREGDKAVADLAKEQMLETYAQTMLQALREVESALAAYRTGRLRMDAQLGTVRASLTMYKAAADAFTADALDIGSLMDARRNLQRSQDDWQKSRSEVFRAYAGVAFSLGGGSLANAEKSERAEAEAGAPAASLPDGLVILENSRSLPGTGWSVELAPLVHRRSLAPTWRVLQHHFSGELRGKSLLALRQGGASDKHEEPEAWFRLSLMGFGAQSDAESFCGAMRQELQACKVVQHGS